MLTHTDFPTWGEIKWTFGPGSGSAAQLTWFTTHFLFLHKRENFFPLLEPHKSVTRENLPTGASAYWVSVSKAILVNIMYESTNYQQQTPEFPAGKYHAAVHPDMQIQSMYLCIF